MYPVTERFRDELRRSHTILSRAEFLYGGESRGTVPIIGGDVTEDSSALVRRHCSLSLTGAAEELIKPTQTNYFESPLWPIGNEVKVWSGVIFADGTEELVPMGLYRISKPRLSKFEGDLVIQVDGFDRSRAVSRNRFTSPYTVVAGTDYGTAIKDLVQSRLPILDDADFDFVPTDGAEGSPVFTTPQLIFLPTDDPWEKALEMARSCGCELLFDADGHCVLRYEPDPLYSDPDWDYIAGETSTMTAIIRDLDDERAYNGVIVTGENNDNVAAVPRGEAWDTNPSSPTYYDPLLPEDSIYGAVPYFLTSQYITSNDQALAAAQANLSRVVGIMERVEINAVPNPALEGSDVLEIQELESGVDALYILDSLRCGLSETDLLAAAARRRRLVS